MKYKDFCQLSVEKQQEYNFYWKDKLKLNRYISLNDFVGIYILNIVWLCLFVISNTIKNTDIMSSAIRLSLIMHKPTIIIIISICILQIKELIRYTISNKKFKAWLKK